MTDDVTRDKHVEMVKISCIFHTKLETHKFDFLERNLIIIYENMTFYGKNTKKSENRMKCLKKIVEILLSGSLRDVIIPYSDWAFLIVGKTGGGGGHFCPPNCFAYNFCYTND